MRFLTSKDVKKLMFVMAAVLISGLLIGQLVVNSMAESYKQGMMAHDYEVAGYLTRNAPTLPEELAQAFTAEKSGSDLEAGRRILQGAGYGEGLDKNLVPAVKSFHQQYRTLSLGLSGFFSLVVLGLVLLFAARRDRRLERAADRISEFMDGNHAVRLPDQEEGSLPKLFSSINVMATSLTAHIEKERRNREFLRDTISDISHQLKTPLAALQMYNEIIRGENSGSDVVESFAEKSADELERMGNLIQNLLKLAKLDAGTLELVQSLQPVKIFLDRCIKSFQTRAQQENKTVTLNCDSALLLNCDEEWLREAVCNILKNALDHTRPQDTVTVTCDDTPVVTRISIKDSGQGIHPEDIHHIFKRFYRSRFSKDKQGVGIGLALAKAIVDKHGGSILVESEPGGGTTFQLIFPKLSNM